MEQRIAAAIVQEQLAAAIGEAMRVIVVGRLGEGCEVSGFLKVQLVHGLAEILQGGGGKAVGALAGRRRAEEDLVEIELEDAVL